MRVLHGAPSGIFLRVWQCALTRDPSIEGSATVHPTARRSRFRSVWASVPGTRACSIIVVSP